MGMKKIYTKEMLQMMEIMDSNHNDSLELEPKVGIFWFNENNKEIVDTTKEEPDKKELERRGLTTGKKLHKDYWNKKRYTTENPRYKKDYRDFPRGRIFMYKNGTFKIMVDSWAENYPYLKQLVIEEFELPKEKTTIEIGSHWEIGSGYEKYMDIE